MKIVVTGASGLLGHATAQEALSRGHQVLALYNQRRPHLPESTRCVKMDLNEPEALTTLLLDEFPDAIYNCAAVSSPADVLANPKEAQQLNVTLPLRLAQVAFHLSVRFVHISTDMVFDGLSGHYRPTDMPNPQNEYGKQKLEAEKQVLRTGQDFATVLRVAIITGNSPSGARSVHERLFELWAQDKKASLYSDELRQPVAASSIASALIELAERPTLHGIFHWAGADAISRYEMGVQIARHFELDPEKLIEKSKLPDEIPPRPTNLTLNLEPLTSKLKTQPQRFATQLEEMLVPPHLANWYTEQTGKLPAFGKRLVKGIDF